jgi:predicted aspartyl protease
MPRRKKEKMKTILLSTVALLALGGMANATDFACSAPQFLVGHESRDPQDTVNRIEVRHGSNSPEWLVHHQFVNGSMVKRQEQYAMFDTSRNGYWSWRGQLSKNSGITMIGELGRDYQGVYYMETQYSGGQITMKTRSPCSQITAMTNPQPPVFQPAPAPAPQPQMTPAEAKRAAARAAAEERRLAAEEARRAVEAERQEAERAAEAERQAAERKAEAERKKAQWEAEQKRKQSEWEMEQEKKRIEWEAEQKRRNVLLDPQYKKVIVPLKIQGNSMRLNVGLGDQVLSMLLDTGATSSLITNSLAISLIRDGQASYAGYSKMITASGEVVTTREVMIKEMWLGNQVVKNVQASAISGDIDLLLGANVLNAIGPYTVDVQNKQLVFTTKEMVPTPVPAPAPAAPVAANNSNT